MLLQVLDQGFELDLQTFCAISNASVMSRVRLGMRYSVLSQVPHQIIFERFRSGLIYGQCMDYSVLLRWSGQSLGILLLDYGCTWTHKALYWEQTEKSDWEHNFMWRVWWCCKEYEGTLQDMYWIEFCYGVWVLIVFGLSKRGKSIWYLLDLKKSFILYNCKHN